ncbi:hypothetical protein KGM_203192 [Danaus plexippus plexippus]|uniref:Uncharacterized protein n=1 Tax=Danaus plexippus plexippus TaxID=278856 RepID=A0A212F1P8_DANPL|nr:hypothetical protein KGM_203192 [Danaus plexippus plexippus]
MSTSNCQRQAVNVSVRLKRSRFLGLHESDNRMMKLLFRPPSASSLLLDLSLNEKRELEQTLVTSHRVQNKAPRVDALDYTFG